jgi:hypothetical protein
MQITQQKENSKAHLESSACSSVVDDAIRILRGKNFSRSKRATENVRNFLVPQPAPTQIFVLGGDHDAAVSRKLSVD